MDRWGLRLCSEELLGIQDVGRKQAEVAFTETGELLRGQTSFSQLMGTAQFDPLGLDCPQKSRFLARASLSTKKLDVVHVEDVGKGVVHKGSFLLQSEALEDWVLPIEPSLLPAACSPFPPPFSPPPTPLCGGSLKFLDRLQQLAPVQSDCSPWEKKVKYRGRCVPEGTNSTLRSLLACDRRDCRSECGNPAVSYLDEIVSLHTLIFDYLGKSF